MPSETGLAASGRNSRAYDSSRRLIVNSGPHWDAQNERVSQYGGAQERTAAIVSIRPTTDSLWNR